MIDVLKLLKRTDKWFLGGGRTLVYAPPFPQHLQTPGLWDEAHLLDFAHPRPFTWTLLDENDREIPLRWESHEWRPDRMTRRWSTTQGLTVTERACCLRDDVLAAEVTVQNDTDQERTLSLVLWTVQQHDGTTRTQTIEAVFPGENTGIAIYRAERPQRRGQAIQENPQVVRLHADRPYAQTGVAQSQVNTFQPIWRYTPFIESGALKFENVPTTGSTGCMYMAATYTVVVPPNSSDTCTLTCSIGDWAGKQQPLSPVTLAESEWREWFAGVPQFACSDPYLTNAYWYRWYGLRLNAIEPGADGPWLAKYPAVTEGISYFRNLISYSAHVHMRDLRWMHDPAFARGSLRNFLDNQKADGSFPGHMFATYRDDSGIMYHADWGRALLAVDELHPDAAFRAEAYAPLVRHARFYLDLRDREKSHLFDVVNHWETGQEYMHRYTAVDQTADSGDEMNPRLKGVDVTLYAYGLFVALAEIAREQGNTIEADEWAAHATATEQAILTIMWDADAGMFSDVNAATMERTNVRAAVCFYPFISLGLGSDDFLRALREHLTNPAEFWTPYPVPAESAADPLFSAEPFWNGERKNCPWNGRVWPMTNSHVLEALAVTAQAFAPDLEPAAAHMLTQFVRMMTVDGDATRPNTYEHYHPYGGTASYYRGIDDYMHSYLIDLIIRFAAGLQPKPDGSLVVHPLPLDLDHFTLTDAPYRGRMIGVRYTRTDGLTVSVNGQDVAHRPDLGPLHVPIRED